MTPQECFLRILQGASRFEVITALKQMRLDRDCTRAYMADLKEELYKWQCAEQERKQTELEAEYNSAVDALYLRYMEEGMKYEDYIRMFPTPPAPLFCLPDPPAMYGYILEYLSGHLISEAGTASPLLATSGDLPQLPEILRTARALKYFQRAIDLGRIIPIAGGLKWKGTKAQLGYFIEKVYCPNATDRIAGKMRKGLERLFDVERLDSILVQNAGAGKRGDVIRWRNEIDETIFL